MEFLEPTVKSEIKYEGNVISLAVDTVSLPNGKQAERELVRHPGGVSVLPIDDEGYVYLVRQFRKPFERELLEAPAGKLSPGEAHFDCGVRELAEETGLSSSSMLYMGSIIPSPGYTDEVIHLYIARELKHSSQALDEDEFLNVERYKFDDVFQMCMNNEISDAKTVALVLKAKFTFNL